MEIVCEMGTCTFGFPLYGSKYWDKSLASSLGEEMLEWRVKEGRYGGILYRYE